MSLEISHIYGVSVVFSELYALSPDHSPNITPGKMYVVMACLNKEDAVRCAVDILESKFVLYSTVSLTCGHVSNTIYTFCKGDDLHCEAEPEQLPNEDEKESDCPVCGKDIDCKTCIMSGQDTCGEEEEPANEEIEPAVHEQEPALSSNGWASWTNDEISVLRTFPTLGDAIEKAYLPGRSESAIKNRYGRLKAEHKILDKSKPFKYVGYAAYLKGMTGVIKSYTDCRTSVNAEMQDGQSIQIKIAHITQEGC